jgi:hypothetical protein
MLLDLVDSMMYVSSCITEVQRFKTTNQLSSQLRELWPLVSESAEMVSKYHARSGARGTTCSFVTAYPR